MSSRIPLLFLLIGFCLSVAACDSTGQQAASGTTSDPSITPSRESNQRVFIAQSPSPNRTETPTPSPTDARSGPDLPKQTPTPLALARTEIAGSVAESTCLEIGGRVVIASLNSKRLKLPLDYRVYLPPCYEENPNTRYPVLYLFHGQSFSDDQWDRLGVDDTANRLVAAGQMSPFLIVMPHDRSGGQPSETNFGEVIVEELLPWIDRKYRTIPERSFRAVGGLSRGAGWSVHLALNYWQLFGAVGAHSPAIFYEDAQRMRPLLDAIPKDAYPRIFIDIGDKDRPEIVQVANWFEGLLNERDIPHEWHMFSGYHEEAYWKSHVKQYLLWYASQW